jgi:hypothetical protein
MIKIIQKSCQSFQLALYTWTNLGNYLASCSFEDSSCHHTKYISVSVPYWKSCSKSPFSTVVTVEYQQEDSWCDPWKEIFSFGNPRSCIGLNQVNIVDVPALEFVFFFCPKFLCWKDDVEKCIAMAQNPLVQLKIWSFLMNALLWIFQNVGRLNGWLVGWLIDWSIDWLVGWLVGWLAGWLAG